MNQNREIMINVFVDGNKFDLLIFVARRIGFTIKSECLKSRNEYCIKKKDGKGDFNFFLKQKYS